MRTMTVERIKDIDALLVKAWRDYSESFLNFKLVPVWGQRDHLTFALTRLISRASEMLKILAEMDM